jgi:hypothetical protein
MNPFLTGFADELTKTAVLGALKSVGKFTVKHPLVALTAAGTLATTALTAKSGYKRGLQGGERPRFLAAAVDKNTGHAAASDAAYTNFHEMLGRRLAKGQLKRIHGDYDERKFKR